MPRYLSPADVARFFPWRAFIGNWSDNVANVKARRRIV